MIKQILVTFIIIFIICAFISLKDKEELGGTTCEDTTDCLEGQTAGKNKKVNAIKWLVNKEYRRGYVVGSNN